MEKIKTYFQTQNIYALPLGAFVLTGLLLILWQACNTEESHLSAVEIPESADTLIPLGYVLVPVQLHNELALQSLLGAYGIVDLFLPIRDGSPGQRVAQGVKIIRAPLNPNQFAVLVPENQSQDLVKQGGPFIAVVQNPKAGEGRVIKEKKKSSRLSYGY